MYVLWLSCGRRPPDWSPPTVWARTIEYAKKIMEGGRVTHLVVTPGVDDVELFGEWLTNVADKVRPPYYWKLVDLQQNECSIIRYFLIQANRKYCNRRQKSISP